MCINVWIARIIQLDLLERQYEKYTVNLIHLHLHLALHTLIHDDTMITFGIRR